MDMESARAKLIQQLSHEIRDSKVLEVMGRIPRELFVPPGSQHAAYESVPPATDSKSATRLRTIT